MILPLAAEVSDGLGDSLDGGGGPSYGRIDPNKKCWITGSLLRTSAWYILIMPWLTLSHVLTWVGLVG